MRVRHKAAPWWMPFHFLPSQRWSERAASYGMLDSKRKQIPTTQLLHTLLAVELADLKRSPEPGGTATGPVHTGLDRPGLELS